MAQECITDGAAEEPQSPAGARLIRLMASSRKFAHARVRSGPLVAVIIRGMRHTQLLSGNTTHGLHTAVP